VSAVGVEGAEPDLAAAEAQARRPVGPTIGFGKFALPIIYQQKSSFTQNSLLSFLYLFGSSAINHTSAPGKSKQYLLKHSALSKSLNSEIPAV
jgi:hypothetical protein